MCHGSVLTQSPLFPQLEDWQFLRALITNSDIAISPFDDFRQDNAARTVNRPAQRQSMQQAQPRGKQKTEKKNATILSNDR